MRRRELLAAAALSVSGCLRLTNDDIGGPDATNATTETPTPTPSPPSTPSPTPSPSQTATESEILELSLISGWNEYGDVVDNAIDTIPPNDPAIIGVRLLIGCNQESDVAASYRIDIEKDGELVSTGSHEIDDAAPECASSTFWEAWIETYYQNDKSLEWEVGEYTAEATVEDFVTGETVMAQTTFEVVAG